jgi:hypothetical protein
MKMPYKYVIESFCDMLGASKAYNPKSWKPQMLLDYWEQKCLGKRIMHEDSVKLLDRFIRQIALDGEENFFEYYNELKDWFKDKYETGDMELI